MADKKKDEKALVPTTPGFLAPEDVRDLQQFFAEGFEQDKTILVGDPADNKIPVFFGELLGSGGAVQVETPGGKPNPTTGEVPMSDLETYIFNPLNAATMTPFRQSTYTLICSYQPARQCRKLLTLAKARSEESGKPVRVQLLIRWNGTLKTRKGNQLNDFDFLHRFVEVGQATPGWENSKTGEPAKGVEAS